MKHLGDICKINGAEVEPVSVIIGGSPCQDLSVAGKRAGLDGERSGLFMEQIRLIKEMRANDKRIGRTDEFIRPRYMVWENVPGAFSSNKGEDFRIVLEETARVADERAVIPMPKKWTPSGAIVGDGWSIAWRVHDAQFWGVPQRRKRIALVADFGGESAPEILFERKSLSRDIEKSEEKRKDSSADIEGSLGTAIGIERERCGAIIAKELSPTIQAAAGTSGNNQPMVCHTLSFQERGGKPGGGKGILIQDERIGALKTGQNRSVCAVGFPLGFRPENTKAYDEKSTTICNGTRPGFTTGVIIENHPQDSRVKISEDGKVQTLSGRMGTGGGNVPMVLDNHPQDSRFKIKENGIFPTMGARQGSEGDPNTLMVMDTYQKTTGSLMASGYDKLGTQEASNDMYVVQSSWDGGQVSPTLTSRNAGGAQRMPDKDNFNAVISFTTEMTPKTDNDNTAFSLRQRDYKDPQAVTYQNKVGTIDCCISKGTSNQPANNDMFVANNRIVRRLTPLECERLQGFPDGWTDIGDWVDSNGKTHKGDSDAPRYKALGNSIALPFWEWMLKRMMKYLDEKTMASLFSGIGGFELCSLRAGIKPLWNSEIEEFPQAVTTKHFGDEEKGIKGDYEKYL